MISIVCASNNKEILEQNLIDSLNNQSYKDYELIVVDTNKHSFQSAAEALNYGANKANGEHIIFIHHDVVIKDKDELKKIYDILNEIGDFGVIGVAGIDKKRNIIGNITNGIPEVKISEDSINKPIEAQTLDEVMFIVKKNFFESHPLSLDNKTWHLYAVEYSLLASEIGKPVLVIPSNIYHKSAGASMNKSYYCEIKRICEIYKEKYKYINTTMGCWNTNKFILRFDILKNKLLIKLINMKNKNK